MITDKTQVYKINNFRKKIDCFIVKWLSILMGVFVTMPIITIKVSGNLLSIFSILFLFFVLYFGMQFFLLNKSIKLNKVSKLLLTWFFGTLISSLFGLLYFSNMPEWIRAIINYVPKIGIYIFVVIIISNSKDKDEITDNFIKGFYIGCLLNCVWAIIEGVVFYTLGYSLNNKIFVDYINTLPPGRQFITIINSQGIRTPGFNYDPAHLGGIIPIITLYSLLNKKYYVFCITILALAFSQSTTALVSSFFLIFANVNKLHFYKMKHKVKAKKLVGSIIVFTIIVVFFMNFNANGNLTDSLSRNVKGFTERVSSVYLKEGTTNIRTLYHVFIPEAIRHSKFRVLTGTGFGTASYSYVLNDIINYKLGYPPKVPYDPESTYISYLFDTGMFGLFLYFLILFKIYKYYNHFWKSDLNSLILSALGGVIFSGIFYHYTLTAYQVLIIIVAAVKIGNPKKKKEINVE